MPVTGSVQATGLSAGVHTITMPQANMTIVGIAFNGTYITIPIDPTRSAVIANAGGTSKVYGNKFHAITFVVSGTVLNYSTFHAATTIVTFYYGSAGEGQLPLLAFAGVAQSATLTTGTGSGTLTFPSGPLALTGLVALDTTGANDITATFNTNSGQSISVYFLAGVAAEQIIPTTLTVSQTVAYTLVGPSSSDVIIFIAYYR